MAHVKNQKGYEVKFPRFLPLCVPPADTAPIL